LLLQKEKIENNVPVNSPTNLERLINLGRISTAKEILYSMEEFHKKMPKSSPKNLLIENFLGRNIPEIELPSPTLKRLLSEFDFEPDPKTRKESLYENPRDFETMDQLKLRYIFTLVFDKSVFEANVDENRWKKHFFFENFKVKSK
jgi:hypothetical protein